MTNSWKCLLVVAVSGLAFVLSSENGQPNDCEEFYQSNGPRISPCKKEIILQQGQNFTLVCRAKTEIKYFKQQEVPEENIGNFSVVQRNESNENAEYQYEVYLDLNNVDRYAIGFYACVDDTVSDQTDVLNTLVDEPSNTEHVSYIYIYVNGTDSLFAPMMEVVSGKSGSYVVECRPSTPDVDVKLFMADIPENTYKRYSPKLGFVYDSDSLEVLTDLASLTMLLTCDFRKQHRTVAKDLLFVKQQKEILQPTVSGGNHEFLANETFSINCTVNYTHNSAHNLTWKLPNESIRGTIHEESNNNNVTGGILYRSIKITNATKEHTGTYTCFSKNICGVRQDSYKKKYLDRAYLKIRGFLNKNEYMVETSQPRFSFAVEIKSYPPANYTFYKNNTEIKTNKNETWDPYGSQASYTIVKKSVEDTDIYSIVVTNGILNESFTYDVRFKSAPEVTFNSNDKTCVYNTMTSLECEVTGYPLPTVTWIFTKDGTERLLETKNVNASSTYREKSVLDILCESTGYVTCKATNKIDKDFKSKNQTRKLIAYEMPGGFGIKYNQPIDSPIWFSERQNISIKCAASVHEFTNVTWMMDDNDDLRELVRYSENALSFIAELNINAITLNHTGTYICRGTKLNGTETNDSMIINVAALQRPVVTFTSNVQKDGNVQRHQSIEMFCEAQGVPLPTIQWRKDDEDFNPEQGVTMTIVNRTTVSSHFYIEHLNDDQVGTYNCKAVSNAGSDMQAVTLVLEELSYTKYIVIVVIIGVIFLILVVYLSCKIKKEKKFRKELAAAGLLYFKEGVTKSLNPDLGIDEQAELLPYNEKFEFPSDKLVYGKQLGAGAFGVVYKAEARGIINAEETTPVAVKMVKKTADNMYIKALASELKIMVHLGKHINIVNLLGACTKNVGKRELVVIVEYCKFGNIHNYMQRHRDVFIDQFSDNNKEKSFGKVNRGYDSSGSTGVQSDYGTANTQDTNNTFLTNNTNQTCRKNVASQPTEVVKVSEGYVQADWRSNYESDYSYDGRSPRPLTSRDLLAWAFQIARGMEYLASRKVLHGDLAARNILLADDNIVKICDFGLARSIYKNDEYQKKENCLLPVKWLAIECMTDRIFSTQSDVWSFGIVLWELFTLAKTPYPNISPANLIQFLSEGHRLDKPAYSDDRIYNLMKRCWEQKPTVRPSFTQLQEILGTFLEDNVRNHYVDLNTEYMDLNSKPENQEDYLDMVCAPDYNNLVTPSPHHYVNEVNNPRSFFPPTPTRVDEEGYLQMSPAGHNEIFSPKPAGTKFDFDPRKYNARPSEASSGGSELTPMLTLNNLPRSGSDSDHEGNASPYLNVCPRIEEETDEVFEIKQNNAKNALNSAVSNPTYITFGNLDVDKKPIDTNKYVNIVPNGLVK